MNNDNEYNQLMSDWYKRVKKLIPTLTMELFEEIINQPNFSIDDFEISKKISIDQEREMNKDLLLRKYRELIGGDNE